MAHHGGEEIGSVPSIAPSWTAWCASCCGLFGTSRAYGYGELNTPPRRNGGSVLGRMRSSATSLSDDDSDSDGMGVEMTNGNHRTGNGKRPPMFTIDGDEDLDLDDALINELLDEEDSKETPEKKQVADQLVKSLVKALGSGDYSDSFAGRLSFKSLKVLFEPVGTVGVEAVAQCLHENTNIQSLEFGINQMEISRSERLPMTMRMIRQNITLRELSLWGNGLTDTIAGLVSEALEVNETLEVLNLNNNDIGDRGLAMIAEALKTNHTLKTLDVSGNNLIADAGTSAIAAALEENKGLVYLSLASNSATSIGAMKLASLISGNKNAVIKKLDVSSNLITDDGIIALALAVSKSNTLREINLSKNIVSDGADKAVQEASKANTSCVITL